jgi:hypothetical protein
VVSVDASSKMHNGAVFVVKSEPDVLDSSSQSQTDAEPTEGESVAEDVRYVGCGRCTSRLGG